MRLRRRKALWAALAAALCTATIPSQAAPGDYPTGPVRIILPFPAGGVLDGLVRSMAQGLQQRLGQSMIIDNQPGASGNIGLGACARAKPDGYTICMTTSDSVSINPFVIRSKQVDPRTLVPVQRLAWIDGVIYTPASSGIASFQQLMDAAAKNPGAVSWGSFGVGSAAHLYMGWLEQEKKVKFLHVPYKGSSPLLQAGLGAEYQAGMLATGILTPYIRTGKLKPLAVLGNKRLAPLPDVPALSELGVKFYIESWFGAFAPPGTSTAIVERLNRELADIVNDPAFKEQSLAVQGMQPAATTRDDFARFLAQDRAKGEELVKVTGITVD